MITVFPARVYDLAFKHKVNQTDLPFIVNGCSGYLSLFYRVAFGKTISCESCCHTHDFLYHIGLKEGSRKAADKELRECAATAGSFPTSLKGVARRVWRFIRAWIMYVCLRLFGRPHWNNSYL